MKDLKKRHGGTRPGAGMPKGYKTAKVLSKEAARDALRTLVLKQLDRLVGAQLANATGLRHTFMRDDAGRFTQLTDPQRIAEALNSGDEGKYYWTFTKDPSVQAFTDLMNRALDKPAEQVQQLEHSGTIAFTWQP